MSQTGLQHSSSLVYGFDQCVYDFENPWLTENLRTLVKYEVTLTHFIMPKEVYRGYVMVRLLRTRAKETIFVESSLASYQPRDRNVKRNFEYPNSLLTNSCDYKV